MPDENSDLRGQIAGLQDALAQTEARLAETLARVAAQRRHAQEGEARNQAAVSGAEARLEALAEENRRLHAASRQGWALARRKQAELRSYDENVAVQLGELAEEHRKLERENAVLRKKESATKARLLGWRQAQRRTGQSLSPKPTNGSRAVSPSASTESCRASSAMPRTQLTPSTSAALLGDLYVAAPAVASPVPAWREEDVPQHVRSVGSATSSTAASSASGPPTPTGQQPEQSPPAATSRATTSPVMVAPLCLGRSLEDVANRAASPAIAFSSLPSSTQPSAPLAVISPRKDLAAVVEEDLAAVVEALSRKAPTQVGSDSVGTSRLESSPSGTCANRSATSACGESPTDVAGTTLYTRANAVQMITVTSPQRLWVEVHSPSSPEDAAIGATPESEASAETSVDDRRPAAPPRAAAGPPCELSLEEASPMSSGRSGTPGGSRRDPGLMSKHAAEAAELSAMVRIRAQAALVGKVAGLPVSPTEDSGELAAAVRLLCYQSALGADEAEAADASSGPCVVASATG